ncbi:pre-mRNA-splicing factor 38A [Planoprotostelium fungivorum]|uniref:Pre-mRNA-splicing factor 38 n=1 Tax=Planoprotostelium fungivorum TaxID=1890364 RepID=A0A2P6NLP7_9EUKA|nr:pre-mRNA-splicing factor 38A [Planoprotostelium fungivorum]
MSRKTDPTAVSIHGTNPQNLIHQIMRDRIYQSMYWKEKCFGLTAETLVDQAMKVHCYGGMFGGVRKPTAFICLVLSMLAIQPELEIVYEFINNEDYKLVGKPKEIYEHLEPLYADHRRVSHIYNSTSAHIRIMTEFGYKPSHVDEVIEEILKTETSCEVAFPYLPKRTILEAQGALGPRISVLEDEVDEEGRGLSAKRDRERDLSAEKDRERDLSAEKDRERDLSAERDMKAKKGRKRDPSPLDRYRREEQSRRSRSPSPSRMNRSPGPSRMSKSPSPEKTKDAVKKRRKPEGERREGTLKLKKAAEAKTATETTKNNADDIAEMNAIRAKLGLAPLK